VSEVDFLLSVDYFFRTSYVLTYEEMSTFTSYLRVGAENGLHTVNRGRPVPREIIS
jgi:hypothetical protein